MKQKPRILPFDELIRVTGELLGSSRREAPHRELLELLCRQFDSAWGAFWQADETSRVLRSVAVWNTETVNLDKLRRDTEDRNLCLSEGNAGQVWRSGKPICTSNLVREMCLPRSLDATEAGLKAGIWFPIKTEETTFGVIELLRKHPWRSDDSFLRELTLLGWELGHSFKKLCATRGRQAS
jgi:hypothetical protein